MKKISSLSSFLCQIPLGVIIFTRRGRVMYWNKEMEKITGRDKKEAIKKEVKEILGFDFSWEEIQRSLEFEEEFFIRNWPIKDHFEEEHLLNLHFFLWKKEGKKTNVMCLVEDVTQKARWGENIRQMEKLSSISRFIASMAHEINNPLTVISGYTQMLLQKAKENRQCEVCRATQRGLEKIEKEAEYCGRLIQELVDFSKPMILNKEDIDLNFLVQDSLSVLDVLMDDKIKLELNFSNDVLLVRVDKSRMRQVFMNLAKNALEAMKEEGGKLQINTRIAPLEHFSFPENGTGNGRFVEIEFIDQGKGIPEKTLPHIFEPFFTTKEKGTGLGLSISYSIVRAHKGWIEVSSQEGGGTRIKVFLPQGGGN
ncbi:MAG TPA: ATP-binding protein [Candidatus Atribacteria bacterium]|nr:ATP-binding protein [Candidatus Atribacteria bacterium]